MHLYHSTMIFRGRQPYLKEKAPWGRGCPPGGLFERGAYFEKLLLPWGLNREGGLSETGAYSIIYGQDVFDILFKCL